VACSPTRSSKTRPVTYPPIGGVNRYTRDTDYWSPRNYDGGSSGTLTIRRALEMSKNLATARLLDGGISGDPASSPRPDLPARDRGRGLSEMRAVLSVRARRPAGAADRPRGFYAAIANEGKRPTPHVVEQITQDGREVYKADERPAPARLGRPGGGVPAPHVLARRGGARHGGSA
jgi:membrane carboxypeptidase/penicillin-binding protein